MSKDDLMLKVYNCKHFLLRKIKGRLNNYPTLEVEDFVGDVLEEAYKRISGGKIRSDLSIDLSIEGLLVKLLRWRVVDEYRKRKFNEEEYLEHCNFLERSKINTEEEVVLKDLRERALEVMSKIFLKKGKQSKKQDSDKVSLKTIYLFLEEFGGEGVKEEFNVGRRMLKRWKSKLRDIPELRDYFEYVKNITNKSRIINFNTDVLVEN